MQIELQLATFLKRYKRFMADVRLADGSEITVHCPNSGSMKTLLTPEVPCAIHDSGNEKRKLRFTLTLLGLPEKASKHWALVDTQRPNAMVEEAILNNTIPELFGYQQIRREVKYGHENSRIDILLESPDRALCYVEIKNNTMLSSVKPGRSDFPDAVTTRGQKHLRELAAMAQKGARAVMFYLVNRSDVSSAGIAESIDPAYAKALREAMSCGVEVLCYQSNLSLRELKVERKIAFDFK
jgi:sugar fermentation stimulation protein A